MKNKLTIDKYCAAFVFVIMLFGSGCTNKLGVQEESSSGLTSVNIGLPNAADLEKSFGKDCGKVSLKDTVAQAVGPLKGCVAVREALKGYKLAASAVACDTGVAGTEINEQTPGAEGVIQETVLSKKFKRGCGYSIKLELGLSENSKLKLPLFENENSDLAKELVVGESINFTLNMKPTAAGIAAGFPGSSIIELQGETELNIEIKFGKPGNPANPPSNPPNNSTPPVVPNTTPTPSAENVVIEFVLPSGWDETSFLGTDKFLLRKIIN